MITVLIVLLLFFESLINCLLGFSYIDELVTLLLIIGAAISLIFNHRKIFSKKEKISIICLCVFALCGIISTLIYNYQNNILLGFEGAFFALKAFLCYFSYRIIYKSRRVNSKHLKIIMHIIEFSVFAIFMLSLVDKLVGIYPVRDIRFGIQTTSLFFDTPTQLAFFSAASIIILCYFRKMKFKNNFMLLFNSLECAILILFTGRMKAIGFLLFFLLLTLIYKFVKKFNPIYLIVLSVVVLFFASGSIEKYFFTEDSPRGLMLSTSFKIATTHIFGSGFSTFGTDLSRTVYSPLYSMFGLSRIYGLSPSYSAYICDSNWPSIIAETGFVGTSCIIIVLYNFLSYNPLKKNKYSSFFIIGCIVYLLFESIGDTIFMTSRGCLLFVFLALIICDYENIKKRGLENE